jgi:hypothetical protein
MESRTDRANRYRKEASKYAELASSDPPGMMGDVHRKLADRYIRMAQDLERREKDLTTALALRASGGGWVRSFGLCLAGIPTRKDRSWPSEHGVIGNSYFDRRRRTTCSASGPPDQAHPSQSQLHREWTRLGRSRLSSRGG